MSTSLLSYLEIIMRHILLLVLTLLLASGLAGQGRGEEKYTLPRRTLPLQKLLIKLNEAGAELSYNPGQLPKLVIKSPGGKKTLSNWLAFLLRNTELTFEDTGAGYIIFPDLDLSRREFSVHGTVTDYDSGERLIATAIRQLGGMSGVLTNEYGFYTISVPGGRQKLRFSYIGYASQEMDLVLRKDTILNIALLPAGNLPQIIVTPTSDAADAAYLTETRSSIGPKETEQMGGPGGEADPLRVARLLPGVETGADGIGGISIRGSEAGHNLILLDGVPVYNLNHAAGLLSIFSSQAIRRVDLYKDGLPARFGGRIGGVLDVHTRDGNLYGYETTVGTSLLAAHFAAEGPIQRGRSSFLITGRSFWGGQFLRRFSEQVKADKGRTGSMNYQVYDLNFKFNQQVGKKGHLYLSLFNGLDDYSNNSRSTDQETVLTSGGAVFPYESIVSREEAVLWGNSVGALRYNHVFNDRFFGNFRLSYSDLLVDANFEKSDSLLERFDDFVENGDVYSGRYGSDIKQLGIAFDGQKNLRRAGEVRFGGEVNFHRFSPQVRSGAVPLTSHPTLSSLEGSNVLRPLQISAYGSYTSRWRGIRYRLGLRGQLWRNGKSFYNLSPRLLLAGKLSEATSWRVTFDQSVQPVHLISSSVIGLPSDLWVPATANFGPSTSRQTALQLTRHFGENWNLVGAAYYRDIDNLVNSTEAGQDWQSSLSLGRGYASGIELTLNKTSGVMSGWLSYTNAESRRNFDEEINLGRPFSFRYGRRHSVKTLIRYQPSANTSITASFRYGSGASYSLSQVALRLSNPANPDDLEQIEIDLTTEINGVKLPDNHRLDINAHFILNDKSNSALEHSFTLGLYNVYNRKNPIYYEIESNYETRGENLVNDRRFKQIFIPGRLPSLSYHMKIRSRK
jgi:hypothetical protein